MARRKPVRIEQVEAQARAKYLLMRQLPGTEYVLTDAGMYPTRGSAGLRKAADLALEAELAASLTGPKKP